MSIKFYFAILRERLPYLMLVVLLLSGAGLVLAVQLPTRYSTQAVLLVEGPQIPDELAASTVQTNAREQLEVLSQRLLTRSNLIEIAREYNAIPDLDRLSPDEIVEEMEKRTLVTTSGQRDLATLMRVGFEANTARVAADVANEYVTRILSESARFRSARAEGTQDFFEQEVDRLADELEIRKARIVEFKNANADALPESLEFNLSRRNDLLETISAADRDKTILTEQRVRLISIFNTTGSIGEPPAALTPEQRQLAELEANLSAALAVYSESSPQVTLLRTRVEQLKQVVAEQTSVEVAEDPQQSILDAELAQIDGRITVIDEVQADAREELEALEEIIDRIPRNSIALESLERDYANTEVQYNTAVERLAIAQTGERIEVLAKGERITVVENAAVPTEPTKPNRPLIAGGGVFLGFASAAGLFLLLELLNTAIRRPKELTSGLGITPFAVLPYMQTKTERRRRNTVKVAVVVLGVGIIAGGLWAVQTYYAPLDFVWRQILDR
ncbi:MAG: lipopolysaccharide biosynthesis, partial [Rhodobacteraceae bacterium]|nr:lipopolysaccharide biosynthesis [Paracoccaceae bacterium]